MIKNMQKMHVILKILKIFLYFVIPNEVKNLSLFVILNEVKNLHQFVILNEVKNLGPHKNYVRGGVFGVPMRTRFEMGCL